MRIVETVAAVNDQRKRAMGAQGHRRLRRQRARQDHRGARPDLQAQHRRHARCALASPSSRRCRMPARAVRAYDPEGMEQAAGRADGRRVRRRTPTPAPRAPTPWSSSPNGTRSAPSTSSRVQGAARAARRRRPAQHLPARGYRRARLHLCERRPPRAAAGGAGRGGRSRDAQARRVLTAAGSVSPQPLASIRIRAT